MSTNTLQDFVYRTESDQSTTIRIVEHNGEPWWVLTDVCAVLEIGNAPMAASRLDDDEKSTISTTDSGNLNAERTIINESGLYSLILTSRKPEAKRFKKWVTSEVLPSIRKTGGYAVVPTPALPPQTKGELVAHEMSAMMKLAALLPDYDRNMQLIAAARATQHLTGENPLLMLGANHLLAPTKGTHTNVTGIGAEIAKLLGYENPIDPRKVNKLLTKWGYQTAHRKSGKLIYRLTEKGEPFGRKIDTVDEKGVTWPQLQWEIGIAEELAENIG